MGDDGLDGGKLLELGEGEEEGGECGVVVNETGL